MRNNPIIVDSSIAGSRTSIQAFLAAALVVALGVPGAWAMVAFPVFTGAISVGVHILTEYFPGVGKVFSAGLSEGAARYLGRKI